MNKYKQKGQSIAEFIVASGVMGMLMVAIPMVSKIATVKLKSEQAADYVAWRVNKGVHINDGAELSREVGQRFFSRTGADVLSDRNADCDNAADQDIAGTSLVNWDSISVENSSKRERYSKTFGTDPLKLAANGFENLKSNGQYLVNVAVPVNSVTGIEKFPESFIIKSTAGTLRNNWMANDYAEIKRTIKKSSFLDMYENMQVPLVNEPYNILIASMGFEHKIQDDGIYRMDVVPDDRKKQIR